MQKLAYYGHHPSPEGKYGQFGGRYVPETLMPAIEELERAYTKFKDDPDFLAELNQIRHYYMGRPTPLYYAARLSEKYGCKIYIKREDLVHGGAHKLNNTMGQALLAKKMGKKKLIAETGAGQHGFATAIAGAYFGMPVTVYMGAVDMKRQAFNVHRMRLLGAKVVPVEIGTQTLKEACSEGLRSWITNVSDSHYLIGSVIGPHPYPMMVRDFQKVISEEIKKDILATEHKLPKAVVACAGGGSNAMGTFYEFIEDTDVQLYAVQAAGLGPETDKHCLSMQKGREGVLHGARLMLLQDENGNVKDTHSISAGLDYPGCGPELCYLKSIHRLMVGGATDEEAVKGCIELSRTEGIIPALESSHAVAFGLNLARTFKKEDILVINLSGQGGKDIETLINRPEVRNL